ncbi:hypothetical protein PC116_g27637, partial [Phytophthora cactorum]
CRAGRHKEGHQPPPASLIVVNKRPQQTNRGGGIRAYSRRNNSEVSDEEAIDLMMQSLSICETEFGRNDNATVTLLATLQTFLRRVGRIEDAERVRADFEERWDEVMDDMTRLKT